MELTESRKLIIIDLISKFKENNTCSMWKTEFDKIINDKVESNIISEILQYKLRLIKNDTKQTFRLTEKGIIFSSFEDCEFENTKNIINNFNGSTIGQFNQSDDLSVLKIDIKQTIQPKAKEKQQSAIISLIEKFWWQILIPLAIVIIGILIERDVININF